MPSLDPHQRPPGGIRQVYKRYQKMKATDLDRDPDILDLSQELAGDRSNQVRVVEEWDGQRLTAAFRAFAGNAAGDQAAPVVVERIKVFEHEAMPGLYIIPSLLPPQIQRTLLSRLLHRDLSNPSHLTNIHTHYNISYPQADASFFSRTPGSTDVIAQPIDPAVHRPLSTSQLLNKKMRWMTLGGQYDWTQKRYPESAPPAFPADLKELLESLYTDTKAEAAIVNLYSPGDTLSVHRDVAEFSSTGLISISLGCDAIFVIGTTPFQSHPSPDDLPNPAEESILTLRLRSGSAVYMSGESRFAWHGVPQVVHGTCPEFLKDWPGETNSNEGECREWTGWMSGKRVNLNVRQMWD